MRRNIFSPSRRRPVRRRSLRSLLTLMLCVGGTLYLGFSVFFYAKIFKADAMTTNESGKTPDGFFNSVPVYLEKNQNFHSNAHCVGETHHPSTAWLYRSCKFQNLCFDVSSKDFYLVQSPTETEFQQNRVSQSFTSTEFSPLHSNISLALGGINPRWQGKGWNRGIEKVKWFPKVLKEAPKDVFFLPSNVIFIPFHSFAGHNVGHLLWDDFYPIFLLQQIFGLVDETSKLMLMRVDTLEVLFASCDIRKNKKKGCAKNFEKFLPLMGVDPQSFSTVKEANFETATKISSKMICAKTAVAGLGMLTDHGFNDHGWLPSSEHEVQNHGKGALFYQFRNYMMKNLGIADVSLNQNNQIQIVLSAHSSNYPERDVSFEDQYDTLSKAFPSASLVTVELATMTLKEQVELVSQSNVFVSTCGGGVMTATFLPRGATLILFYNETGGFNFFNESLTGEPAYLDWDLFNNAGFLRVHWLPIGSMNTAAGLKSLESLVRHEIDIIKNWW